MKKFISILLCTMLLVGSLCATAYAAEPGNTITYGGNGTLEYALPATEEWQSYNTYIIESGCTFVIPSGRTLNVPLNATLKVMNGAHLVVNGQLNVSGEMEVYGKLSGTNITGTGSKKCEVRFPNLEANSNVLNSVIEVGYYCNNNNPSDYYGDVGTDITTYTRVASTGQSIMVEYNQYLFIHVYIKEAVGVDKFDDKLYPVFYNNTRVPFAQNACPVLITTSGDVSYGDWRDDGREFYNTYTITLPEGEGYTVYGRNGEYGEITLKWGDAFSFRVELEEEFNKSDYVVYVYNGNGWTNLEKDALLAGIEPAKPDAEGYYTIPSITGNHSIFVEGVLSNEVLDIFGQVFSILKQVWEAIVGIFNELMSMFGG